MQPSAPAILLETRRFWVIDKPAGLAVHPGPRTADSLEALLPSLVPKNRPAPRAVHRLDRDTSGCLLVARDAAALRALSAAFAEGRIAKTYHAIIGNPPAGDSGVIKTPLRKQSSRAAGWRMVADAGGSPAVTHWAILARAQEHALVAFRPETGRTHQLRVHATLLDHGCAIVGDPVYGVPHPLGMMLHASVLTVPDPWADPPESRTARAPGPSRFAVMGFPIPC